MKDLTVLLEDRPGTLADVGEALGTAGVNIEGMCGFALEGKGAGHVLVEDPAGARAAIEGAGGQVVDERDVLVLDVDNRPGALGAVARRLANAGVNIDLVYVVAGNRVVVGVDDLEKARSAL